MTHTPSAPVAAPDPTIPGIIRASYKVSIENIPDGVCVWVDVYSGATGEWTEKARIPLVGGTTFISALTDVDTVLRTATLDLYRELLAVVRSL